MIATFRKPVFATRQPLLIAGVRAVLAGAGLDADPQVVRPEELERTLAQMGDCVVILDCHALPSLDSLRALCLSAPHSIFILWTVRPSGEVLQAAMECGVHGLLSTRLPLREASEALVRICRGERLLRFDPEPGPLELPRPQRLTSREQQVLFVLAEGGTNSEIAAALHCTGSSVKACLSQMFRKTGTHNRGDLVSLCRSGILAIAKPQEYAAVPLPFDAQWMLDGSESRQGQV